MFDAGIVFGFIAHVPCLAIQEQSTAVIAIVDSCRVRAAMCFVHAMCLCVYVSVLQTRARLYICTYEYSVYVSLYIECVYVCIRLCVCHYVHAHQHRIEQRFK